MPTFTNREGRKTMRRTQQTQTRLTSDTKPDSRPSTGTGGKRKPPKKTKARNVFDAFVVL